MRPLCIGVVLLLLLPWVHAEESYKPYLHEVEVPENPGLEHYGTYATQLYPGAGTYSYELPVLEGRRGIQPSLSAQYTTQRMKETESIVGAGWSFSSFTILRDINHTAWDTSDDSYVLQLGHSSHKLIYDSSYEFYRTKPASQIKAELVNDAWVVTSSDGTRYVLKTSVVSNRDYTVEWYVDLVNDTFGNTMEFSYSILDDAGEQYLQSISYNNERSRVVELHYEPRPLSRLRYSLGTPQELGHRLSFVQVLFNDSLVDRFAFEYKPLSNEHTIYSLTNISRYGSDNTTLGHAVRFDYHTPTNHYRNESVLIPTLFSESAGEEMGARLFDLDNDGRVELVMGRHNVHRAWKHVSNDSFEEISGFSLPYAFVDSLDRDNGMRAVDVNGDGFTDLVQGLDSLKRTWMRNGTSWYRTPLWDPPINFVYTENEDRIDKAVRFSDVNADGLVDLVKARGAENVAYVYLNNGSGWEWQQTHWQFPTYFTSSSEKDNAVRLMDLNGDGLVDVIRSVKGEESAVSSVWMNNGSGWTINTNYTTEVYFTEDDLEDSGARITDMNGDGLMDVLIQKKSSGVITNHTWFNTGSGFVNVSSQWKLPRSLNSEGRNMGRRLADLTGNGFADLIISYRVNGVFDQKEIFYRNNTIPFLLSNITHENGGVTSLSYTPSTRYNNTGQDGQSDLGFVVWTVANMTQHNNAPGLFNTKTRTQYTYESGVYDTNSSEFRGFGIVNETHPDYVTTHYFLQGKDLGGMEYRNEVRNKSHELLSLETHDYTTVSSAETFFILNKQTHSISFDDLSNLSRGVQRSLDSYGNVVVVHDLGDLFVNGDERTTKYSYVYNVSAWIISLPSSEIVLDYDNSTLSQSFTAYDQGAIGQSPAQGSPTLTRQWNSHGEDVITQTTYNEHGLVQTQVDALGGVTRYYYDDLRETFASRVINGLGHTTNAEFNARGLMIFQNTDGRITHYVYDLLGRLVGEIQPGDSTTLPTIRTAYDLDGVVPETVTVSTKTVGAESVDSTYHYDGFGNLLQVISDHDQGLVSTSLTYDDQFRVNVTTTPTFVSDKTLSQPDATNSTVYTYDTLGRVVQVMYPDNSAIQTQFGLTQIEDIDQNDHITTYTLDEHGRISAVTEYLLDPYLNTSLVYNTTYEYDGLNNLVNITDTQGNSFLFEYDSLSRKISLDDPYLGTWTYTYDANGNLISQTDSRGEVISLSYDILDRIIQKNSSSATYMFTYDEHIPGSLSSVTSGSDTVRYTYDDRLRVIAETRMLNEESFTRSLNYDARDEIVQIFHPDNQEIDVYHGPGGLIDSVSGFTLNATYSRFGTPTELSYSNLKNRQWSYDDLGRLSQVEMNGAENLSYSYDSASNIIGLEDNWHNRTHAMSYDDLDRLTSASINEFAWTYEYDTLGSLLKIVRNYSQTSTFSSFDGPVHASKRKVITPTGVSPYQLHDSNTTALNKIYTVYLVNDANTSLSNVSWKNRIGGIEVLSNEFNLESQEEILVVIERILESAGHHELHTEGLVSGLITSNISTSFSFGHEITGSVQLQATSTALTHSFIVENTLSTAVSNASWNCSGIASTSFEINAHDSVMVILEQNESYGSSEVKCEVSLGTYADSVVIPVTYTGLSVEQYNATWIDETKLLVSFYVNNTFEHQTVHTQVTGEGVSLDITEPVDSGKWYSALLNFTSGGSKTVGISLEGEYGNASYFEHFSLDWLVIEDYSLTMKNATSSVISLSLENQQDMITLAGWNSTTPVLQNETLLNSSEMVFIILEEDLSHGVQQNHLVVMNTSSEEMRVIDTIEVDEIGVSELEVLSSKGQSGVAFTVLSNNRETSTVSWEYDDGVFVHGSSLEVKSGEPVFMVVESSYNESGVHEVTFLVNTSQIRDNRSSVVIV